MKKRGILSNIVGFLLVAIIVFVGIAVPTILLDKQERDILDSTQFHSIEKKAPVSFSQKTELSYADILLLVIAEQGTPITSEPRKGELSMTQAVETARNELQVLSGMGLLSDVNFNTIAFSQATYCIYKKNPHLSVTDSYIGLWNIEFNDTDVTVFVYLDGTSGKLLSVGANKTNIEADAETSARIFAKYLGLYDDNMEATKGTHGNACKMWAGDQLYIRSIVSEDTIDISLIPVT